MVAVGLIGAGVLSATLVSDLPPPNAVPAIYVSPRAKAPEPIVVTRLRVAGR
jgi:hypothetical protein